MDYIREELLRQQKLFLMLLSEGGELKSEERSTPEAEKSPAAEDTAGETVWKPVFPTEKAAAAPAQAGGGEWQTAKAAGRLFGAGSSGGGNRPAGGPSGGSSATEYAAFSRPLFAGEEKALAARELSRAFERDARRYDGGYPLY